MSWAAWRLNGWTSVMVSPFDVVAIPKIPPAMAVAADHVSAGSAWHKGLRYALVSDGHRERPVGARCRLRAGADGFTIGPLRRRACPCVFEASEESLIPYYSRFGFEQIGEIDIPGGPTMIPMWRAPR